MHRSIDISMAELDALFSRVPGVFAKSIAEAQSITMQAGINAFANPSNERLKCMFPSVARALISSQLLRLAAGCQWARHPGTCPGTPLKRRPSLKYLQLVMIGVGFLIASQLAAADRPADDVARFVRAEMKRQKIPGLALLVSRNGEQIRTEGYGLSNVELQVPVKPETIFQSGSVGKQFTATAVMMLVEAGKVGLQDPLTKYFPQAPKWWKEVTVRELLSHTAGFTDYPSDFDMRKDYSEEDLLGVVSAIPPAYPPGTKWSYSNLGYLTLGILIHKVTGEFYGDFLQRRIFGPLGMSTTRIINEADIIPNRAAGYRVADGHLKNQEWVSPTLNTTADGSLYFSVLDLAKWDAALYTEKLIKRASMQEMWTVATLRDGKPNSGHYGFGWFVGSEGGHHVVEHEGQWQGFETQISRYIDDGLTVVVLTNLADAKPKRIADGVAAIYLSKKPPP
jgi:CubicO group peptidase (beta-lactamase class C family)